jgi:Kef-type K+ transport system membrane component KefB
VILGAAVVDDVLALVLLGVVVATFAPARGAAGGPTTALPLILKTVGFLVLAIVIGVKLTPTWFRQAARLQTQGALLAAGLCFCFLLSWAASRIGLAGLVGAFAAGLVLEDAHSAAFVQRGERSLGELLQPMTAFLVPVFFVLVGFRADLSVLAEPRLLLLPLALTAAAIAGKLVSAGGVLRGDARRWVVACGMIPRGELALVFAAMGGALRSGSGPLLDHHAYTAVVAVVILTTLVTPPALRATIRGGTGSHQLTRPAA